MTALRALPVAVLTFILGASAVADAAVWHVANNGVDGAACGSREAPCRSISAAIARAADGDRVVVGPGRYGDVHGDRDFDDPGDEAAELQDGPGCGCLVHVNKRLTVESSHGASATVLDAGGAPIAVVRISADGVVLGTRRQGFTLVGGRTGVAVRAASPGSLSGVRVESNRSAGHSQDGFGADPDDPAVADLQLVGNTAAANGRHGFLLNFTGGEIVENTASDNGAMGFSFVRGGGNLTRNFAGGNRSDGFSFRSGELTANLASHNGGAGFVLGGQRLRGNASIANGGFGVLFPFDGFRLDLRTTVVHGNRLGGIRTETDLVAGEVARSNIFGNGGETNCGFVNASGEVITLGENFWGVSAGPGPDPADAVCDFAPAATFLESAARRPYRIPVRVGR